MREPVRRAGVLSFAVLVNDPMNPHRSAQRGSVSRIVIGVIAVIALLLIAVRFIGSPIATALINKKLAALPEYSGHVDAIQLALWRGTIGAKNLVLVSRGHEAEGHVVRVQHASLSLALRPLFSAKLGGRGSIDGAEILIAPDDPAGKADDSKEEKERKKQERAAKARRWQSVLREGFPLEITHFEISHLRVHFVDRTRDPHPDLLLEDFHLVATGFGAGPNAAGDLPATLTVDATMPGGSVLAVKVSANPGMAQPRFTATMEVRELALVPLHDLMLAYANIDVSAGTFDVFVEVNAEGGHYVRYVKPFFRDLKFKAVPDPEKNFAQRAATKVASAVTDLLKNKEGQVATKAPFEGDFADNNVDLFTTIDNLLRNAFVQSLREGLEGQKPNG